ncbi:MAG: DUF6316 family protein [Gammaproteobacteria bacterium]
MFQVERVFSSRNPQTGQIEWFFMAREGNFGPFRDKATAQKELDAFVKNCIKTGEDGGRSGDTKKKTKLTLLPMNDYALKRGK